MKTLKSIQKNQAQLNSLLMEKWGYGSPKNEISHLCAMLVTEKTTGKIGHPINHTLLEGGSVTHYDVEFDDVIVEGMPVSALEVEIQEEHHHSAGRRDYDHDEGKPRTKYDEVVQEQDDFDLDDLDDDMSAPDLQSDAFAATMDTAMAPPPPTATANAPMMEKEGEDLTGDGKIDSDDYLAAKDKAIKANLEEQHNCKSAHPGMNHDQWSEKYR